MKIVTVVCSYPPYRGGIGNAAARQAAALRDAGHEVLVLCPAHDGMARQETLDGIEVRRLTPMLSHGVSAFIPSVAKHLRGADAVYLHYPFYGGAEAAVLGAYYWGIPYVVYFHMDVVAQGLKGAFLKAYDYTAAAVILRGAKKVLVSSLDYAHHASINRLNLPTLQELPFCIDTDFYCPGNPDKDELAARGIDPSIPIVLFVGGMDAGHAFKGIPELIKAMGGLKPDEAQLVLVGDGELRHGYEKLAQSQCTVKVHFLGSICDNALSQYYRAACVTVLPSVSAAEAFGIVLIESMASGTPVLASNLPGVRTVMDENCGVLVPPGDSDSLRDAIHRLLADRSKLTAMGEAARLRALGLYSRTRERADLAALFENLAA